MLSHSIKNNNIYITQTHKISKSQYNHNNHKKYIKKNIHIKSNIESIKVSSIPFICNKLSNNEYSCQIIRDIEFSTVLDPKSYILLEVYLINIKESNLNKKRYLIKHIYEKYNTKTNTLADNLYSNNYIKSLVKIKLDYNDINKSYTKKYSNHYKITKELFDKSIIYKVLSDKLPPELIKHICKFINTEVKFGITIHKCLSNDKNYYLSNPSLQFSDYIIPS